MNNIPYHKNDEELALIRAGYRRGTGDLYNCWLKPRLSLQQHISGLAQYAVAIAIGVAGLLYVSV